MTSRSISRSGLLISACIGCGSGTPATAPTAPLAGSQIQQGVELVLVNGKVFGTAAQAIAIDHGVITAVGTDAEINALSSSTTRRIDLHGFTVTSGLIDAHCHLYGLGVDLESVSVRGKPTEAETAAVAIAAAKSRPASEWLIGRGWDQTRWAKAEFPTKVSLDAITDRPVLLRRVDGHAAWVNSQALAAAGITKATKDPAGGKIVRDAKGEPTGVLIDNAVDLVDAKVPAASAEVRERRILAGASQAIAAGITAVHEMGIDDATADVYAKLAADKRLPLRVYAFLAGDPSATGLARLAKAPAPPVGRFTMRGVKFFADGALGSRGARLYKPYDDDPKNLGLWVTDPKVLANAIDVAVANGWQVAVHAIGDAAVGAVIDGYTAAQKAHPGDLRLRIEHTQVISTADIARMASIHAIASMQPTHATSDMRWAEARIGKGRIDGAYAWRAILAANIPLAFGSDFPVEDVPPLFGIYAAVTRKDREGNPPAGWYTGAALSLAEAVAGFTSGAAYAEHAEATRGTIAVGRPADLTIYDRELTPESVLHATVTHTFVDGQMVYGPVDPVRAPLPAAGH